MVFVHQPTNAIEKVTIKYQEKGRTSMSADSSHQMVQRKIAKYKVSHFEDFRQAVKETGTKAATMTHHDDFQPGCPRRS